MNYIEKWENMNMHETIDGDGFQYIKVPNGFLYRFWDYNKEAFGTESTFVPK